MERINKFYSPLDNNRYSSFQSNNFAYESSKDNNDLNTEITVRDKKVLDNSLKEIRREINEMSNKIKQLNNKTDKIIQNKNNKFKNFRSNSFNLEKMIPNKNYDNLRSQKIGLNNNFMLNSFYNSNNLKNTQNNFLQNNRYQNCPKNNFNNTANMFYKPNGNNNIPILNYSNYKNNKYNYNNINNINNISQPKKIYNQQNINYRAMTDLNPNNSNNSNKINIKNINNTKALSVDNDNISEKLKSNEMYYYLSQIKQKDDMIKTLKEEINKIIKYKKQNENINNNINNNNEPQDQILKKNRELIEENEKLKLKLKNQIETERKIMKDKIKTNIMNNSQGDEIIKINNQIEYWKDEYDKLYAENITLKKNVDNLTNENDLLKNDSETLKNMKKDITIIMKEKEDLELQLKNNKDNQSFLDKINALNKEIEEKNKENINNKKKLEEYDL